MILSPLTSMATKCLFASRLVFFASKMQASSTQKTKDSIGRRLGIKKFGGQEVYPGDIVARQRGFKWHPGTNTYVGKDHTIHSKVEGIVNFRPSIPNRKVKIPMPYNYHPELFPERAVRNHPAVQVNQKGKVVFEE